MRDDKRAPAVRSKNSSCYNVSICLQRSRKKIYFNLQKQTIILYSIYVYRRQPRDDKKKPFQFQFNFSQLSHLSPSTTFNKKNTLYMYILYLFCTHIFESLCLTSILLWFCHRPITSYYYILMISVLLFSLYCTVVYKM